MRTETVPQAIHGVRQLFLDTGRIVVRGEWQALRDDRPQMVVFEAYDISLRVKVSRSVATWAKEVDPNLPWAEDHFKERVSGEPLNPGEQFKNWPWYEQGVEEHKETGQFSHTYMERFWPKRAGYLQGLEKAEPRQGIGFEYGDLYTLVNILLHRPLTRQAYLPIWFPEDLTASEKGERVPCTLGYHFMAVPGDDSSSILNMVYTLRSCDWFRYFRDDMYMAGRLLQWVADEVGMLPGTLTMHINNLHIFNGEQHRLKEDHQAEIARRLSGAF